MCTKKRLKYSQTSQTDLQYSDNDWCNGSIKSITLENFMCHSNFHLTFNPRINFISGLNGSGKSAIQTALVVGFGARASITNRANSLKSLIKYGCSSATISITISNSKNEYPHLPFRPEVYGKQITIVRQITETGYIPYKFLNEHGRVVKVNKNELKNMTIHFNILVDNPICVMNQAMVKTFHKSADPRDKYDLFYKGISANIYSDNIEKTKLIANEYAEKLSNAECVLKECCKEVNEYETYEIKCKQLKSLKICKNEFENEYAWAIVSNHKTTYKEYLKQIEMFETNMLQDSNKIKEFEDKMKTLSVTLKVKKEELDNVEETRSHNHFIYMELKKELQIKMNKIEEVQLIVRKHCSNLRILDNDKKDIEKFIEIERRKGNVNNIEQLKKLLASYEQNISEVDAAWKTNMEHEQTLRNTVDDLIQRIGNLKNNEVTPLQRRISELNRNINSMSQQQDRINFYGNWMPKLVQTIENCFKQNKFIKKPVGPIGAYIKVNNDKWIFAIENNLGRATLKTFLVDNFKDNKVLQFIMDKIIPGNTKKPTIITSKFFNKVHDISFKETKSSMFSMLTFSNPVVANCLIDNNRIETIMLVDKTTEAMHLMENSSTVPKNCYFSLTLDGTQVYPSPSYRVYSLQSPCDPVLLQSDVSVAINNLKHEKEVLEKKIIHLNKEFENVEQSKLEKQQHLNKTQSETRLLKAKYDDYFIKINELRAKCHEEQDDRLSSLLDEINNINKNIADNIQLKEDSQKPIAVYEREIKLINEKIVNIKAIIDNSDRSVIHNNIENFQTQFDTIKAEMLQINDNMLQKKQALNNLVKKAEEENKILKQVKKEAESMCDKIKITRNVNDISRDIEMANQNYQLLEMELKKRGKDHLVLRDEYIKKKENYIHHKELYKKIADIYQLNLKIVELSIIGLKSYIYNILLKVEESFALVLAIRKIKGKLEINQSEQSMVITMFDNISTSCASGGERTFATVALILSLWSNMKMPFYSIDEYDVYMDNVNRLATTQLLMVFIKNYQNQYIFLTPQDISFVKSEHNVKIVQLKEPRS